RMGGYVGFRPFFLLIGADDQPSKAFIVEFNSESPSEQAMEVVLITICPDWAPFASELAQDLAFKAGFEEDEIPASIRTFCRASEIKLSDVDRCIGGQLRASAAAKALLDEGAVSQADYQVCRQAARSAGGYNDLKDVASCMERTRN